MLLVNTGAIKVAIKINKNNCNLTQVAVDYYVIFHQI